MIRYRVKHRRYFASTPGGQCFVIDAGHEVIRDDPQTTPRPSLVCDPVVVAVFADESTANAVCSDLNRGG